MAKKTPSKKRKPNTLDAISGTDALEVLRILANRDKELSKEIDAIAKDLLADVSLDEVADCVQAELESLAVEDVWDRSGARRDGYVDPGETAWQMFEAALEPFREDMLKYQQTSMLEQVQEICLGILKAFTISSGIRRRSSKIGRSTRQPSTFGNILEMGISWRMEYAFQTTVVTCET